MTGPPVGRRAAWEALLARLGTSTSSMILIAGPPGSGRTYLLSRMGEAARRLGYTVVGSDDPVVIEPTTKLNDIRRALTALLGREDEAPGEHQPTAVPGPLRQAIRSIADRVRDDAAISGLLDKAAPIVVAVDGYSPSGALAVWFTSWLIPHVRASRARVVFVVADRIEALAGLHDLADEVVELGPLDAGEVGQYFRSIGSRLQPPLSDEEMAVYCQAVAADPGMLTPLGRVLGLLAAGR